jgi:hypothetical protein
MITIDRVARMAEVARVEGKMFVSVNVVDLGELVRLAGTARMRELNDFETRRLARQAGAA